MNLPRPLLRGECLKNFRGIYSGLLRTSPDPSEGGECLTACVGKIVGYYYFITIYYLLLMIRYTV